MKKITKRLTMIVAILLSLVLLTSSIVSTTLAKYVVTKSAKTTATLDAFGVTVDLDTTGLGDPTKTTNAGDSISFEFSNLTLHPDDVVKTISASVYGKPSVDANIVVDVEVKFTSSDFSIGDGNFTGKANRATFFPIEFKVGTKVSSAAYVTANSTNISNDIKTDIENALITTGTIDKVEGKIKWTAGKEISKDSPKTVSLNFSWPKTYGQDADDYDEIGTFISKKQPTFTITYKISVEQA
jgi:hypothetical protein